MRFYIQRRRVTEEGEPLNYDNEEKFGSGMDEGERAELFKAWVKSGRPGCRIVGPKGNVMRFADEKALVKFLGVLPRKWNYLSPGGYGSIKGIYRQMVDNWTWRDGRVWAADVKNGSRYILFIPVDKENTFMI